MKTEDKEQLPITEQENPRARDLDSLSAMELVRLMNNEDAQVALAVEKVLADVARAVEGAASRLKAGGRLFYVGAGTSGRLGVLDAAECPPTFGTDPSMVQAVIAGGNDAVWRATEASEDDRAAGARDLLAKNFAGTDALVGLSASGQTPYTVGALDYARSLGALTVAVTCAPGSLLARAAEVSIAPVVGPEVVAGSTRLKAGTAQKMILNMISTATMIRLGYVSGNRMSNLQARNTKLRARAVRILMQEAGLDEKDAQEALQRAEGELPVAIVMSRTGRTREIVKDALKNSRGLIPDAVRLLQASEAEGGKSPKDTKAG